MNGDISLKIYGDCHFLHNEMANEGFDMQLNLPNKCEIIDLNASNNSISIVCDNGKTYSIFENSIMKHKNDLEFQSSPFVQTFFHSNPNISTIKAVSSGNSFTFWLSEDGNLYQIGLNISSEPTQFNIDSDKTIKFFKISACRSSFITMDASEKIYFWPDIIKNQKPIFISLPFTINQIQCGDNCAWIRSSSSVFFLSKDGTYSCLNCPNQFYDGSNEIKHISCGPDFVVGLDTTGTVWAWGSFGPLHFFGSELSPHKIAEKIFSVFALPGRVIFVNEDGSISGIGLNQKGQLGDGTKKNRIRVFKSQILGFPLLISGGDDFTVIYYSEYDPRLLHADSSELVPEILSCPFEKHEDLIE